MATKGGSCPFMIFTEDYLQIKGEENLVHRPSINSQTPGEPTLDQESMGLSLHYCNIDTLSDGSHRIGWFVRRYKQDFITTLQKYGSLPAQTTKDVFTLADTVRKKEHEIKEIRKTVENGKAELSQKTEQLNEALNANQQLKADLDKKGKCCTIF